MNFLSIVGIPFFVFGIIQAFRGFRAVFDSDMKQINESDNPLCMLLFPATILGYIAVIVVICCGLQFLYSLL